MGCALCWGCRSHQQSKKRNGMAEFQGIPTEQPKKKKSALRLVAEWFTIGMLVIILGITAIVGYGCYRVNRVTTKALDGTERLLHKGIQEGEELIDKGSEEIQELIDHGSDEVQELILDEEDSDK